MAAPKLSINARIKERGGAVKSAPSRKSLWTGPNGDGPNGGVTQTLIGRYLVCRERFRVYAMDGLRPRDKFNPRIEFGNLWHACEEGLAKMCPGEPHWMDNLEKEADRLARVYHMDRPAITHWVAIAAALFPRYVDYWSKHKDVQTREPLLQEHKFDVPYQLPSGRIVLLRGKWDAVDVVDIGGRGLWIQENKTKSGIDAPSLSRQLTFDLQSMMYFIALEDEKNPIQRDSWLSTQPAAGLPLLGIRYNVVKRPAHKSVESMLKKLDDDIADNRAGEWFSRWNVNVHPADVQRFKRECFDPVLENLYDDWEWLDLCHRGKADPFGVGRDQAFPHHQARHFRMPYGVYNPLTEAGPHDLNDVVDTGSEVGFRRVNVLFPELV